MVLLIASAALVVLVTTRALTLIVALAGALLAWLTLHDAAAALLAGLLSGLASSTMLNWLHRHGGLLACGALMLEAGVAGLAAAAFVYAVVEAGSTLIVSFTVALASAIAMLLVIRRRLQLH